MIIYLPFIYFLVVFLFIYSRRGLDISACIIGVYMITALCAIFLHSSHIEYSQKEVTLIPTIIYCSMITIVTAPFYRFNSTIQRELPMMNPKIFNILSWSMIIGFVFSVILFKDDVLFRLAMGERIGELRGDANIGSIQSTLSGTTRAISSIFVVLISMSAVSFILFFYSVTFLNKKWYFNVLLFISTMGCMISGIMGIDRSITFYWIIDLLFIYVMMRPYLSRKIRTISSIMGLFMIGVASSYLVLMTLSRFGSGATDSLIRYMGQNYINFCWYWDNYEAPVINWGFFFPVSTHFLHIDWGCPVEPVSFGWYVETKVGFFVNSFYTFMGSVMLYLGQWAVIPYCLLFNFVANVVINKGGVVGVQTFIRIFVFSIVIYNGVILYVLVDYIRELGALILLFFCYLMDKKTIV